MLKEFIKTAANTAGWILGIYTGIRLADTASKVVRKTFDTLDKKVDDALKN